MDAQTREEPPDLGALVVSGHPSSPELLHDRLVREDQPRRGSSTPVGISRACWMSSSRRVWTFGEDLGHAWPPGSRWRCGGAQGSIRRTDRGSPPRRQVLDRYDRHGWRALWHDRRTHPSAPDRWLRDGDKVTLGETEFEVYHCPGHTPGHVIFFHRQARFAQVGDVLFAGSIGRTDFPKGNYADLIASITGRLWPLGDDVTFGPRPRTDLDIRQPSGGRTNPFVSDEALAQARS